MPQSKKNIPRITAGPIDDLGVVVNKLVKVGFARIKAIVAEPKRCTLYIDTLFGSGYIDASFGSETAKDIPKHNVDFIMWDNSHFMILRQIQDYLSEKKMYLSRASFLGEDSDSITGDLYKEN